MRLHRRVEADTPVRRKYFARPLADRHNIGVELSLRPRKRERDRMEIEVLDQWACLLEPPGDACGESQRTTVRLSAFTVDDQP